MVVADRGGLPNRGNRKKARTQDGRPLRRYRKRWRVERLFAWLQNWLGFVHLGCTEARVRNLYQEVQLRYQQLPEKDAKAAFVKIIERKSFELKGNRLLFYVRDPMLGQWFQEWVADVDGFTDSSFNPNLVLLQPNIVVFRVRVMPVRKAPCAGNGRCPWQARQRGGRASRERPSGWSVSAPGPRCTSQAKDLGHCRRGAPCQGCGQTH